MKSMTVKQLAAELRTGPYTSVGGYPKFFVAEDGSTYAWKTVKASAAEYMRATRDYAKGERWNAEKAIIGVDVNWEDPDLYDDETGERIESAYAEEEAEGHLSGNNPKTRKKAKKKPARKKAKKKPARKKAKKRVKKKARKKALPKSSPAEERLKMRMRKLIPGGR